MRYLAEGEYIVRVDIGTHSKQESRQERTQQEHEAHPDYTERQTAREGTMTKQDALNPAEEIRKLQLNFAPTARQTRAAYLKMLGIDPDNYEQMTDELRKERERGKPCPDCVVAASVNYPEWF